MWLVLSLLLCLLPVSTTTVCSREPPIRELTVHLEDFGGSPALLDNAPAFEEAVRHLRARGGGELVLGPGVWVSAPFNMTSGMTLRINPGGTLKAISDISAYPVLPPLPTYGQGRDYGDGHYSSLVHGENLRDVAIVGSGSSSVIDGSGAVWWNASGAHGGAVQLKFTRGHMVEFINTTGIHISSIKLQNSPFWTVHPYTSDQVYICDLEILNPAHSPNTDGVDPDSSSNVLIEHSRFSVGDDCVAIKSGWDCFGYRPGLARPAVNISIVDLQCSSPTSAGICIGSEMSGGVQNVHVRGFVGRDVSTGLRVKTARSRGGSVSGISMEDVQLDGAETAVQVNAFYGDRNPACGLLPGPGYHTPVVSGITLQNWSGVNVNSVADLEGLSDSVTYDLHFADFRMSAKAGWKCSAVNGTTKNVQPPACSLLTPVS